MDCQDEGTEKPELFHLWAERGNRQMEAATLTYFYGEAVFYLLLSPDLCTSIPQRASALGASESGCKEVMHRIRDSS